MERILIYGTGTMATGIAQVAATAGKTVFIVPPWRDMSLAQGSRDKIRAQLDRAVQKGTQTPENAALVMERIVTAPDMAELAGQVDLLLEAVIEDLGAKKEVFTLAKGLPFDEGTVFATNSSALSITELANCTGRPGMFAGIHFFNPAPVMGLVEIVKGAATEPGTVEKAKAFAESLGKTPIVVSEAPGFVVNRILVPMINEAVFALMEGVASAEDIDRGMKLGANHPIGPLALADLIGLDVCLSVMETLYREFGDPKYRPCPLLSKYVRAGFLGRKAGRGFFAYGR